MSSQIRAEPYRILFPLAVALAWAGVLPWLVFGLGLYGGYPSAFHAMTQIQGAMTCFGLGFLLTFVPRRTGTKPVAGWALVLFCLAPVATAIAAWWSKWVIAHVGWWIAIVTLIAFINQRSRQARGPTKLHASFIWVPISLGAVLVASIAVGIGTANAPDWMWVHEVGNKVILQGLFTGLILGVGGLLLPVLTRGEDPALGDSDETRRRSRIAHACLAACYFGSFPLEHLSVRGAFIIRALVVLFVLTYYVKLWRTPNQAGLSRWLIWLSAWMLPLGYAEGAIFPDYRLIGLHIVFIGGFWTMAATISTHVALSHGGRPERTRGRPWQLYAMGGLLVAALVGRALVMLDPYHVRRWMAVTASCFLLAAVPWCALVLPVLRHRGTVAGERLPLPVNPVGPRAPGP